MFKLQRGIDTLRQPDRNPRCYEMTEQELADEDELNFYQGA